MTVKLSRQFLLVSILCILGLTLAVSCKAKVLPTSSTTTTKTVTTTNKPHTTVKGVSPKQGRQAQTLSVTISGTNFKGTTAISFGSDIKVTDIIVTSSTVIKATIAISSHSAAGSRVVTVTSPSGKGELKAGFTVTSNVPTVKSVSPNKGKQGQTIAVKVTGTNFTSTSGIAFGNDIKVDSFNVTSSTTITANITISSHASVGSRTVSVNNSSGSGVLNAGFDITSNGTTTTTKATPTTKTTATPKTTSK
jgi:hypothetical protein